mgnify:CR=1 FL=1
MNYFLPQPSDFEYESPADTLRRYVLCCVELMNITDDVSDVPPCAVSDTACLRFGVSEDEDTVPGQARHVLHSSIDDSNYVPPLPRDERAAYIGAAIQALGVMLDLGRIRPWEHAADMAGFIPGTLRALNIILMEGARIEATWDRDGRDMHPSGLWPSVARIMGGMAPISKDTSSDGLTQADAARRLMVAINGVPDGLTHLDMDGATQRIRRAIDRGYLQTNGLPGRAKRIGGQSFELWLRATTGDERKRAQDAADLRADALPRTQEHDYKF